jgi:DNA-binding transcriptional MerR regulator
VASNERKQESDEKKRLVTSEIIIPDKLYFRIGEVASLCRLPAYVLRFWETEFSQLKPVKSSTGQRMYRKRDVESVVRIKKLLYDDGFTIAGARVQLREETKSERNQTPLPFPMPPSVSRAAHLRQRVAADSADSFAAALTVSRGFDFHPAIFKPVYIKR